MFYRRHCRHVRRTAQACFVGEHAALYTHDDRAAHQATEGLVEAERALDDGREHGRYVVELQHDHVQGHGDVDQGLDRHQQVGDRGDTLDPADENQAQQHRQREAGVGGVEAEGVVQRVGDSVCLQAVEGKAEGHQQQERHDHPQPALVQAVLDVIRRAATVGAFSVGALVQLAEGALDKARRHAHQRGDPHPEHGTRATQRHGNADTGDVTGTHAAGQAEHQRLERAELAGAALEAVFKHREHVEKVTQLHETRADREITAEPDYEHDQYFP
ncbi:hypothetical protein PFLmoz3_01248 [Pseudomonas fluorescens]|uniref:Uncharacterized protein n=1 Tax=Pseudomonas fluorescens TaxID=294 RepID=A0A109LIU0_PSEFL|nr:hypothetical protein PFLmoz3_01248 [Pseudomonas fluorescens]